MGISILRKNIWNILHTVLWSMNISNTNSISLINKFFSKFSSFSAWSCFSYRHNHTTFSVKSSTLDLISAYYNHQSCKNINLISFVLANSEETKITGASNCSKTLKKHIICIVIFSLPQLYISLGKKLEAVARQLESEI